MGEEEEEEDDFLAASWASSKTVCSDAFDFLFDEKNMNPENVLEKHPDVIEIKPDKDFGKDASLPNGKSQQSKCCVISWNQLQLYNYCCLNINISENRQKDVNIACHILCCNNSF